MIIIGLSGKAEHGKTTAANYVLEELKNDYRIGVIPLAKRMKEQAKMLGWDGQKDERGRRLLQEVSWPIKHYYGEDIYAKWCLDQAKEAGLSILLIDDVRMLAEVNYFKEAEKNGEIEKFVLVRIDRPGHVSKLTKKQLEDVSETQLDNYDFDYRINNDETIERLGRQVSHITWTAAH